MRAQVRQLLDLPDVKPYADLAAGYASDNSDRMMRVAEQHMAVFSGVRVRCCCAG